MHAQIGMVCFKAGQSTTELFYRVGSNTKKSHFKRCHAPLQNEMTLLLSLDVITDLKGWL